LQEGPGERPLFLVHPVEGSVMAYRELAVALGSETTVYGLQCPALDGGPLPGSAEDLARAYRAAIRGAQPAGPYRLGGWSLGGVLAYEIAQQLRAEGEVVELLVLLDTLTPAAQRALEALGALPPVGEAAPNPRAAAVSRALAAATRAYSPAPTAGPLVLIRAAEGPALAPGDGWEALAQGGLRAHTIPGDHHSILTRAGQGPLLGLLRDQLRALPVSRRP
jgi:thioesterase domain-containing protein